MATTSPDGKTSTKPRHSARFTETILEPLDTIVPAITGMVFDPFGGTGERAGAWADRHGLEFRGVEIEPSFIIDYRIVEGDATSPASYPTEPFTILTSPTYANGMNDHFVASDSSRRHTYRQDVATNEGADRELHPNNSGRWGFRGAVASGRVDVSAKAAEYWRIHDEAVAIWAQRATRALVNVKPWRAGGLTYRLDHEWVALLEQRGFTIAQVIEVRSPGMRHGENLTDVDTGPLDFEVWLDAYISQHPTTPAGDIR